jgi:XRE family transcriptional regulator, regulator of sulfur utilization
MSQSVHVGDAVRRLRESANMSVRALASKCGFSPSFISQVENGQSSPSIASLERIAAALSVTLVQFFQATAQPSPAVVRGSQRAGMTSGWSRARLELLGSGSVLEPLMITLAPSGASGKTPTVHPGHQFAIVIDGTVMLTLEETEERLEQGDAVTIPPATRHRWHNISTEPAQILLVTVRVAR